MQVHQLSPMGEFSLKETSPNIPSKKAMGGAFNMVERMEFLYIRIVKAKDLFAPPEPEYDPYVEVRVGNYRALTKLGEKKPNPEWNHVFAFSKDRIHAIYIEVLLKNKSPEGDGEKGRVMLDVHEVPKRAPPDSPLAPEWYKLEDWGAVSVKGELMMAVWMGTQADEAFTEAWHLDAMGATYEGVVNTKSKVYMSPKLWYVRVNVIQCENLEIAGKNNRRPELFVKAVLGDTMARTRISVTMNHLNPLWNEDLMFVASEPFENQIVLTVEDKVGNNKEEVIGKCVIHLGKFERRLIDKPVNPVWYNLEKPQVTGEGENKKLEWVGSNSKLQLRASLDGGYHVLDETTQHSSDMRPTVRQLWKQEIGVLELGILNAVGLPPMKITNEGKGRTDAYCVAKYGQKWVRTRTIMDSSAPKWNEQYTWTVYDPCTVITVGVFDNFHYQGPDINKDTLDSRIGKLRIRLSTLQTDKIYTHSYPLLVLKPQGLTKMGELQLAIRFTCPSIMNLLQVYTRPILPTMHYSHPLSIFQQEYLRQQATKLLSSRLGRSEPPLRKEVVEYMLDYESRTWSKRKTIANFQRIRTALSGLEATSRVVEQICCWQKPALTVLVNLFLLFLIIYPQYLISSILFNFFAIGIWMYKSRPRHPSHMDPQMSNALRLSQEELEEEFDGIPTRCNNIDVLKARYDRLRMIAGQVQVLLGDLATQVERVHSLFNWRDPRASTLFVIICLFSGILFAVIPGRLIFILIVVFKLRPPSLRNKAPSVPGNFFRRLPAKIDSIL